MLGAGPVLEALARSHVSDWVIIEVIGDGNDLVILDVLLFSDLLAAVLVELALLLMVRIVHGD